MKHKTDDKIRKGIQKYGITLGKPISTTNHIYDVVSVNGHKTTDKCCKIFINTSPSEVSSEYEIGKQCYEQDNQHFMKIYDLIPFTIEDDIFDGYEKKCYAMFMDRGIPFTFAPGPKYVQFYKKFITDIAIALKTLHGLGFVHFDIKPDNIVINAHGNYALIDFGISKSVDGTVNLLDISGTRFFTAPELFKGELSKQADIYSLGLTLRFILMNGVNEIKPFGSIKQLYLQKKNLEPLKSDDSYVQQFLNIVNKASAFYTSDRYETVDEILEDIGKFPVKQDIRFYSMCYCDKAV